MGRLIPKDMEGEFYGFFAFSGKATAFLAPLLLGLLTEAFHSQRAGFSVVLLFFIMGGGILIGVKETKGPPQKQAGSSTRGRGKRAGAKGKKTGSEDSRIKD